MSSVGSRLGAGLGVFGRKLNQQLNVIGEMAGAIL